MDPTATAAATATARHGFKPVEDFAVRTGQDAFGVFGRAAREAGEEADVCFRVGGLWDRDGGGGYAVGYAVGRCGVCVGECILCVRGVRSGVGRTEGGRGGCVGEWCAEREVGY